MTVSLVLGRVTETLTQREEGHVMTETDIGMMQLQMKGHSRLPGAPSGHRKLGDNVEQILSQSLQKQLTLWPL